MNTLEMLKTYAREISPGVCETIPSEVVCSVMLANNWILAAAIIESGGKLLISSESVCEMLTGSTHVVAVTAEDGSLTVSLAAKDEILSNPEAMAL